MLGYLIVGILISPILALLNVDVISIQHFVEFGVVMMLFLIGLELEPRALWDMRHKLLGLGGLQVALSTLALMGVAMAYDQPWGVALAIGLTLSLSSTAIVLQTLSEKGLMQTNGGRSVFSVLLTQDIAVIPIMIGEHRAALEQALGPPSNAHELDPKLYGNAFADERDENKDRDDAPALQLAADLWCCRVVERREDGEPALARRALLELGLHLLQFARGRAAQRCQDLGAQVCDELSGVLVHFGTACFLALQGSTGSITFQSRARAI